MAAIRIPKNIPTAKINKTNLPNFDLVGLYVLISSLTFLLFAIFSPQN